MSLIGLRIIDRLSPEHQRILRGMARTRPIMAAAAAAVRRDMQAHYSNLPGNKRGWPSRRFWQKEGARKTHIAELTATRARIAVASPAMAHKLEGGTVKPKRGRALALPVTAEAYRAGSPREGGIANLILFKRKGAVRSGTGAFLGTRVGKAIRIMYALVPRVTHRPDKRAFPGRRAALDAAVLAMGRAIDALVRRR